MKKLVLSLAILATMSLSTFAGTTRDKDSGRGRKSAMSELNLSADQQEKMKSIREEYRTKQKELADSHRKEVESILTPEQQTKMKELRDSKIQERRSDRKEHSHKGKRGAKGMNLDAQTVAKLDTLKADFEKEKKSVELSRIAPDAQKQRLSELKEKYRTERRQIVKEARQTCATSKTI